MKKSTRFVMLSLSVLLSTSMGVAGTSGAADSTTDGSKSAEDMDKITELNRLIWRWRRCVSRWEEQHGPSKDGKPPEVCGPEPQLPKP